MGGKHRLPPVGSHSPVWTLQGLDAQAPHPAMPGQPFTALNTSVLPASDVPESTPTRTPRVDTQTPRSVRAPDSQDAGTSVYSLPSARPSVPGSDLQGNRPDLQPGKRERCANPGTASSQAPGFWV